MIKLTKSNIPNILATNSEEWTKKLMNYISSGKEIPETIAKRYNQAEIKEALRNETHCKCMYCESYISAVAPEHIEHYRPKSLYPRLTFNWDNLGLACPWCNMNKKDSFDETCTIVNPYKDNPNDYFISLGTMIKHTPGNKRGELTEELLKLNRPELLECRKNAINNIAPLLDRYMSENNPSLKQILKENIEKELEDDKSYAMCLRAYVKATCIL